MIKEYELYQNGVAYNNSLEPSFYDEVDCNWDFVYSKQWRNAKLDSDKPAPVFNYLNRFATFFIASIMSSNPKVKFASVVDDDTDDTYPQDESSQRPVQLRCSYSACRNLPADNCGNDACGSCCQI